MAGKIEARVVIEIIGAPQNHVEEVMKNVVEKFKAEDGLKVIKENTAECKETENKLWATFSEIEFETSHIQKIADVCFDYMPSSVEILSPAGLDMDTSMLADMFNEVLAKLHGYAMNAKKVDAENRLLNARIDKLRQENLALMKKVQ
ncbi:MAG: hypothetical protein PHO02_03570 [Candidatus Nanoarchaeia archaeon]|nr:hypothetical protein [Candidatus Nanoarchaeia archaeon]